MEIQEDQRRGRPRVAELSERPDAKHERDAAANTAGKLQEESAGSFESAAVKQLRHQ